MGVVIDKLLGKPLLHDHGATTHNHDDDYVNVTGDTMTGALNITPTADVIPLYIKGSASQTENLIFAEQNDGTNAFFLDPTGNIWTAGWGSVGSISNPNHNQPGDFTVERLSIPNNSPVTGTLLYMQGTPYTLPSGTTKRMYLNLTVRPNADNGDAVAIQVDQVTSSTAASTGVFYGINLNSYHLTGAFNTGTFEGVTTHVGNTVATTTTTEANAFHAYVKYNGGTITTARAFYADTEADVSPGAIGDFTYYDTKTPGTFPTSIATFKGLNIANLGNAAVTDAIGIDITSPTNAAGANVGLRVSLPSGGTSAYALQLSDTTGVAAGGITFGTDTNLYRVAASVLATDDSIRALGYGYVGSVAAPTNATAGDFTATRLKVVNGAFGTGVDFSVTGDGALSGFLRVGSETAPANTTAGDLTAIRLAIGGDNTAFSAGGRFMRAGGTMTDTAAGAAYYWFIQPAVTPASNSSSDFRLLGFDGICNPSTGITVNLLNGGLFQWRLRGDGAITGCQALGGTAVVIDSGSAATVGTVTTATGITGAIFSRPSGTSVITITTGVGITSAGISQAGATLTDAIHFRTTAHTQGTFTNITGLLINAQTGTNTTVTNFYGIDIASSNRHTTDLWQIRVAYPAIQGSQAGTTNLIGIGMPAVSVILGNTTGTTTMVAGIYLGIPTYTSTTNVRTVTDLHTVYIAGPPSASTKVVVGTNGPSALWIAASTTSIDGAASGGTKAVNYNAYFGIPTYTAVTATRTVTDAANVYIAGAPVASTNVTLTAAWSLWVAGGTTRLDGDLQIGETAYYDAEVDNGNSSTADTIDWGVGNCQKSTMTGDCTYTFTAPPGPCHLTLKLVQDNGGGRNPAWPAAVKWAGGAEPTWSTANGAIDIIEFYFDGTNYFGAANIGFA